MTHRKITYRTCILIILAVMGSFSYAEPAKKGRYNIATEKVAKAVRGLLSPLTLLTREIINATSLSQPVVKAIEHVGNELPVITQKVTDVINENTLKLIEEAIEIWEKKAEVAAQKLEGNIAQGISQGMGDGCEPLHIMAQQIMEEAKVTADEIGEIVEKRSRNITSHSTRKVAYSATLSSSAIAGITVAAVAANRYAQGGTHRNAYCICAGLLWAAASLYGVDIAVAE